MKLGYYPGCSLHATTREYSMSMEAVSKVINLELEEVNDWNCCGATPAHTTKQELGIALPYANLINASKQGLENIVAPCAACYNRLKTADYEVKHSIPVKERINELLGETISGNLRVINIIEYFRDTFGIKKLKSMVSKPLKDLKIACYYGCLLVRPGKILQFDDEEQPESMDQIISAIGGTPVEWSAKTECCGGSHAFPLKDVVLELSGKIFSSAKIAGADCIAVACPLCHSNLDMREHQINKKFNTDYNIPVFYITQLIGLALNIPPKKLGVDLHFLNTGKVIKNIVQN